MSPNLNPSKDQNPDSEQIWRNTIRHEIQNYKSDGLSLSTSDIAVGMLSSTDLEAIVNNIVQHIEAHDTHLREQLLEAVSNGAVVFTDSQRTLDEYREQLEGAIIRIYGGTE